MKQYFLIGALAAAFLLSLPASAMAGEGEAAESKASSRAVTKKACGQLPLTNVAHSVDNQSTSSTFVDVAGSRLSISVGGTGASCVIVSFSAQAFAPGAGRGMHVRAVLDGVASVDEDILFVVESQTISDAHAYNFLFPSVSP